ncbi:MAG: hypothetical protein EBR30_23855 [Cytophagia bacterium]|nr:hypothetical protein [Cytophagia bacterium]
MYFFMKSLISILFTVIGTQAFSQNQYYERQLLESDFDSLINIITKVHPNPYAYIDKHQFELLIASKRSLLPDSATKLDFFKMISPIMTSIKDAHSFLVLDQKEYLDSKGLFLSFGIRIINDRIIVNNDPEQILKRGLEIESINGISAFTIVEYLKNM